MELSNKIKQLRTQRGIKQEKLAEAMGVSAQAVSKWETGAALPDISLLPELAVYFGVTIDELFSISDDKEFERIQNMIWEKRDLTEQDIERAEKWLDAKIASSYRVADCHDLRANMYNALANRYHERAAESAKMALEDDFTCDALNELNEGMAGRVPDWCMRNHYMLIEYLKDFTEKHPEDRRGWIWLLDNLLDDYRLKEAEDALRGLEKADDNTFRPPLYRANYLWYKGDRAAARETISELERDFPNDWMALMSIAEYAAMDGDYSRAIDYIKKAIVAQANDEKRPRFSDPYMLLAQFCELNGDIEGAIAAHESELELLREDYGVTSGETRDAVVRKIERLKKKLNGSK
ncbi:MAG: helix-turn-helix transcriptional regulator [Clostridia bacterium]|nr:helix-turn-helix transcriptional regulator [Clostridia bacterium]